HRALVSEAIAALHAPAPIPVLGSVPRAAALELPERHLGLVQAGEHADLDRWLDRLADLAEQHIDLDAVMAAAAPLSSPPPSPASALPPTAALPPPGQPIALARDQAFS